MKIKPCLQNEFLQSAAFLRREFLSTIRDEHDNQGDITRSRREHTIFLFDSDLIVAACQPWTPTAIRYGTVFPRLPPARDGAQNEADSENEETRIRELWGRAGTMLASHVLEEIRAQALPVYQFKEHFDDTQRIFEKNARYFAHLEKSWIPISEITERERIRRTVAVIKDGLERSANPMPALQALFESLEPFRVARTVPEQRLQAWENFIKLNTRTGGIYPAEYVAGHLAPEARDRLGNLLDVLRVDARLTEPENTLFSDIADVMELRIRHFASPENKSENMRRDAEAVARLYLVNARLAAAQEENNGPHWRAVLVTGARALTEACYGDPEDFQPKLPQLAKIQGIDREIAVSLSHRYVRHLWAYTTEALLGKGYKQEPSDLPAQSAHDQRALVSPTNLRRWLDGLLGTQAMHREFTEHSLTRIARAPVTNRTPVTQVTADDFEKWERTLKDAITQDRLANFEKLKTRGQALIGKILTKTGYQRLELLQRDVAEQVERAKDRAFVELSESGAIAIVLSAEFGERNPPDLAFGSLKNTNRIFDLLSGKLAPDKQGDSGKIDFRKALTAIHDDCYDPDASGDPEEDGDDRQRNHLKFLAIGTAFAAANKWGVALSQAQRAVAIIERSQRAGALSESPYKAAPIKVKKNAGGSDNTHMSGREAYFLCASAQRIVASREWEYAFAEDCLKKAERALQRDREAGFGKNTTNVRFWNERLAIKLSRYYLSRMLAEEMSTADLGELYCDEAAHAVFDEMGKLLSGIEEEGRLGFPFGDPRADFGHLGRITVCAIAVNIIQCCVIRIFRRMNTRPLPKRFPATEADLRQAVHLIHDLLHPPFGASWQPVRNSTLTKSYLQLGQFFLGEPGIAPTEAQFLIDHGKSVTVYDPWRFGQLKTFCDDIAELGPETLRGYLFN